MGSGEQRTAGDRVPDQGRGHASTPHRGAEEGAVAAHSEASGEPARRRDRAKPRLASPFCAEFFSPTLSEYTVLQSTE